ncbi:helicase HerA domain-containing protein [Pseudomonas sp. NCHU5208]|uniref:helicase HerA domain-containing protein n=1 Tax=unclassified Pseudomonas TaxID=196821 RepID=UPI003F969BA3
MTPVLIGYDYWRRKNDHKNELVQWDPSRLANHHIGIAGTSGAGKTHWIRNFIQGQADDVVIDIFDYHGDIEVPGAKTVLFSESTKYGFNPLVLNPDPHFGGVRRAINDVIAAIGNTSRALGTNQEGVLRALLTDAYALKGISATNPSTWYRNEATDEQIKQLIEAHDWNGLRQVYPTLHDVTTLARRKLKALWMGIEDKEDGRQVLTAFDEFCRVMATLNKRRMKNATQAADEAELAQLDSKLGSIKIRALDGFSTFLDRMQSGREFEEVVKYNSRDVLLSVINRLENLQAIGIFNSNPPPFGKARIRRYNLKPIAQSEDELRMFVHFRLQAIIREEMQRGESHGRIRRFVVIDECVLFNDESRSNPINVIANQMRKFGLAILQAGQSPTHMSEEFLSSAGTMLLLNLAPTNWDSAARRLKIDAKMLQYLQAQHTGAVRLTEKGQIPAFRQVYFA